MCANDPERDGSPMTSVQTTVPLFIPVEHNGPRGSANGGIAAGLLATRLGGSVCVRLHRPPPLGSRLDVVRTPTGIAAMVDDREVLTAEPSPPPAVDVPTVTIADATRATRPRDGHLAPTCVVCGPDREDGLGLFPGAVAQGNAHAALWTPPAWTDDGAGDVRPELVWGALDCPGAFAILDGGLPDGFFPALGSITATRLAPIAVGEPLVVLAWLLGNDGKRWHAATAIVDARGRPRALALQTCIAVAVSFATNA